MHLPPVAAVLRVSQLTMSPASSLWKVWGVNRQLCEQSRTAGDSQWTWSSGDDDRLPASCCCPQQCELSQLSALSTRCVWCALLTEHVSTLVLATTLLRDVALDAQVNQRKVLDAKIGGVDAPNHAEPPAVVNIAAQLLELWPQGGERKVPGLDQIPILAQGWVVLDVPM